MDTSTTPNPPKFSFIIVNYQSAALLPACFSSFQNITVPGKYECIVVNNDPREQPALLDLQKKFNFTLLPLDGNRGFGFATNRGAEHAHGSILVFLNPDARFLSGNFSDIENAFKRHPSLGIIGMKLFIEPEKPQPWSTGESISLLSIVRNHLALSVSTPLWNATKPQKVSWVSGAALAIPRTLFFRIHGFDERFFLYYEDVDLCARTKQLRKNILFMPRIRVLHRGGGSMEGAQALQKRAYFASQDRYFSLHRPYHEHLLLKWLRKLFRL
ncbi:MAG: glycosyltransferase family 2 protein [Candidatus Moraniibacteriota bacterium]|nr:MAG: glycosyltransferase family 2 protein [Candidatus Moranbacteria bacterium]